MTISQDFVKIIKNIEKSVDVPFIHKIFIPELKSSCEKGKKHNFGALVLEDKTVGLVFLSLDKSFKEKKNKLDLEKFEKENPFSLAKKFTSENQITKTLALGAINSISQFIFKNSDFKFDFTTDSMGLLDIKPGDNIGMVGFFPPLVKKIKDMNKLIVIEKKNHYIQHHENWEVTLNPKRLLDCNKILITSTTVLNESIDEILSYTNNAEKISMIGPTAGFLPDSLFSRGIDVIGGTYVSDPELFMELIQKRKKWGPSTDKYCIQKVNYEGFENLI